VLADIKGAVQQALDSGQTETWFKAQLVDTLKAKGWWGPQVVVDADTQEARIVQAGSLRRLQTIYRTNLQSAYMAGRHRQALEQRDRAPWAQYLAVMDQRTRPAHGSLHGKVFALESAAWSVVSPPNGYNCRCRARYLSDQELADRGLKPATDVQLLERDPPGRRPADPLTGETPARWVQRGVSVADPTQDSGRAVLYADPGWDHLPGSDGAERALVERVLKRAVQRGPGILAAVVAQAAAAGVRLNPLLREALPAWPADGAQCPERGPTELAAGQCPGPLPRARPFDRARLLPGGQSDAWYVERFLAEFGASMTQAVVFEDVTGESLLISADLFLARRHSAKAGAAVYKVQKNGREAYLPLLAQTIKRPQEVWERVEWNAAAGRTVLRRRYLAWWLLGADEQPGLAVFEWSSQWWGGITAFPMQRAQGGDLDAYVADQRQGLLRYRE